MAFYALLLGASEFSHWPALSNPAFGRSHAKFLDYLREVRGVPDENICNLFESERNATDQLEELTDFLERLPRKADLFVHYVGHGGFVSSQRFFLGLKAAKSGREDGTCLIFETFATRLRTFTASKRVFVILDCCFAAAAVKHLMGPAGDLMSSKVDESLRVRGVTVLAASSKDEAAYAPDGLSLTMFSDAMFRVLEQVDEPRSEVLTLRELKALIEESIATRFSTDGVRPKVHTPYQPVGDIADHPIFPLRRVDAIGIKSEREPVPPTVAQAPVAIRLQRRESFNAAVARSEGLDGAQVAQWQLDATDAKRKRLAKAEAERQRLAEAEAERHRLAEAEAERQRLAEAEAERQRLAEAEAERKRLAEAEAERQRLAEAEAERKRLAEAEAERERAEEQRLAAVKAKRERLAAKAERRRLAAEQERLAEEKRAREQSAQQKVERVRLEQQRGERVLRWTVTLVLMLAGGLIVLRLASPSKASPETNSSRKVDVATLLPTTETWRVPVGSSPTLGPDDALVTIIEFADFQYPPCAEVQPTLLKVREQHGADIRRVWKDLPLVVHPEALPAATFAREVLARKGISSFWKAQGFLFARQNDLGNPVYETLASLFGLSASTTLRAVTSDTHHVAIDADVAVASTLNVNQIPTFFVNGTRLDGPDDTALLATVDRELEVAKRLVANGVPRKDVFEERTKAGRTSAAPIQGDSR
ncbi:MAG: thioredoxin domain-containing protein [Labilithrix sp.]|nr:thioredoxin domain-containing protein [Labilithrix sp.]